MRIADNNGKEFISHDGEMVVMPHDHFSVHNGEIWLAERSASVNNGATMVVTITTGTKPMHLGWACITGGSARIEFFEGPTVTGAGTAFSPAPVNLNRVKQVALTTGVAFKHTPTTTADGTTLLDRQTPGGTSPATKVGNEARGGSEWVLKSGTTYMMRITNSSGSAATVNPVFEFYEED